ncbi:MAG: hypothetical protein AB1638_03870 [Nitrospirota bacterium]
MEPSCEESSFGNSSGYFTDLLRMPDYSRDIAIFLNCEGMGDCLYAIPVIKRAIYHNEDPHYKVTYVKGRSCALYCCEAFNCSVYGEFKCIPTVNQVLNVVSDKLELLKSRTKI